LRKNIFFHILIIGGALEVPSFRNRDVLPESALFYKKWALACNAPFLKRWSFFKRGRFVLKAHF
jgi:hypothetical protein